MSPCIFLPKQLEKWVFERVNSYPTAAFFKLFRYMFILLILSLVGCHRDSNDSVAIQTPLQTKPLVTLIPVIDNTRNNQYDWNLSEEFTSIIYSYLKQSPLVLDPLPKTKAAFKNCKDTQNPFGIQTSWMKRAFQDKQFIVFLELVQHEEVFKQHKKEIDPKMCAADLNLTMRIRIFDLRGETPKVVLQELIQDTHFIPKQFTCINFDQVPWGDDSFNFSPLGLAHLEFAREISTRVEDYIFLAMNKL